MYKTIAELIEASEKNGWEWARSGSSQRSDRNCATFSCVVGQGLANLFNNNRNHSYTFPGKGVFNQRTGNPDLDQAFYEIYRYNDNKAKTYEEAVAFMKERLAPFQDLGVDL